MKARLALLSACALALFLLTAVGLVIDPPAVPGGPHVARLGWLVILLVASAAIYGVSVGLVLRRAWPRGTVWFVLGVAALLRVLLLTAPPMLSTDIYRYVWDGRVQAAGINPYRYIPADPALARLRDARVYPHINRKEYARTIYPPVAEMVFAAAGRLWDSVNSFRLAAIAFEALGIFAMLRLLAMAGLPPERILIYAWNPLALWSFASDGHVDAIAVGFTGLALLLRARRRLGWAGAALGAAVMAKFLPLVVAPALLRGGTFWRPALAGLAVILLGYAAYSGAGAHVLGFLPGYAGEEGLASGQGFWLLAGLGDLLPLPAFAPAFYVALAALLYAALVWRMLARPAPANDAARLAADAGLLIGFALFVISPHYHWYFAWAALPAVVAPSAALLWLATAPLLLIIDPLGDSRFLWPALIYGPVLLLLAAESRLHARRPAPLQTVEGSSCPQR
ncbi:hypothetical protein [Acidisoma sp. C75]